MLTAMVGVSLFLQILVQEHGLSSKRLVRSEVIGLFGGVSALVLMAKLTVSGFTDAGGPVDWLLVGLIWGGGLAGTTLLSDALLGLMEVRRSRYS